MPVLRTLLADQVAPVRFAAADALAAAGDTRTLLEAAREHGDPATRRRAFLAADRAAALDAPALVVVLERDDPATGPEAARLVAERAGAKGLAPLRAALATATCPAIRVEAARGLAALGTEASGALVLALASTDGDVRRAAAEALARSGGAAHEEDLARAIAQPLDDSDLAAAAALLAIESRTGAGARPTHAASQEGP